MQDKPTEISAMGSCCMLTVIDHTGYGVIRIAGQPAFFNRQRDYTVFIVAQSRMGQAIIGRPCRSATPGRRASTCTPLSTISPSRGEITGQIRGGCNDLEDLHSGAQSSDGETSDAPSRRGRVVAARGARSKSLALRYATANRIRLIEQCASAVWRRNIPFGAGFEKTVDNANQQFSACRNCGYAEISKQPRAEESRI